MDLINVANSYGICNHSHIYALQKYCQIYSKNITQPIYLQRDDFVLTMFSATR